jgi:hypothetical protein
MVKKGKNRYLKIGAVALLFATLLLCAAWILSIPKGLSMETIQQWANKSELLKDVNVSDINVTTETILGVTVHTFIYDKTKPVNYTIEGQTYTVEYIDKGEVIYDSTGNIIDEITYK